METLFWHDYETFGVDARKDRPCQFAGVRTDLDLHVIDEPVNWFCKPAADFLPDPLSCAITGILPQYAKAQGLAEAEFCARIHGQLAEPGTCGVGYNNLRFDDEVTRHLLYRNFYDPYEREWKNGNSRWDLIDLVRMTHALRPEGIEWPLNEDGTPSFRLELLTKANGLAHESAHDALSDVYATIAIARLIKTKQPKLYDYLFQLRNKHRVLPLLDLIKQEPVVHISRMFAASRGALAIVMPLCRHPSNPNAIIVADLISDPDTWLALPPEEMKRRLYQRSEERPAGEARIPLKAVHINRCPALAPLSVLTDAVLKRFAIDLLAVGRHRERIRGTPGLSQSVQALFASPSEQQVEDPDLMLYSGSFLGDHDKRLAQRIREARPEELSGFAGQLRDARLPELLFRYRARNFPQTLSGVEQARWHQHCALRLQGKLPGAGVSLAQFTQTLAEPLERITPAMKLQLQAYASELSAACGLA